MFSSKGRYSIDQEAIPEFDKLLRRKQLAGIEKKLLEEEGYYHAGVLLNKAELRKKAMGMLDAKVEFPKDLEIYISRSSVAAKPYEFKVPEYVKDL